MNCKDFRARLDCAIESREVSVSANNELRRHVLECPDPECRRRWEDEQLLTNAVSRWHGSVPKISLVERVLDELRRPGRDTENSGGRRFGAGQAPVPSVSAPSRPTGTARKLLACAVSAASLMLVLSLFRSSEQVRIARELHSDRPRPVLLSPEEEQWLTAEGPEAVSDVLSTYSVVPETATDFLNNTMVMLLDTEAEAAPASTTRPASWTGRLGEQIRPWGRNVGAVLDAFLDSVADSPDSCRLDRTDDAACARPV